MKRLNKWLLPLLALVVLAGAALLPPQLSAWRDGKLSTVHAEEAEAANEILTVPELPERIELLSRWLQDSAAVVFASQEINAGDRAAGSGQSAQFLYDRELKGLAEAGFVPDSGVAETFWETGKAGYTQLYRRGERGNVEYLLVSVWSREMEAYLELIIDEESGLSLAMCLNHPSLVQYTQDARRIGAAFVERLGLDYRLQDEGSEARFRLSGSYVEYVCTSAGGTILIQPQDEWQKP